MAFVGGGVFSTHTMDSTTLSNFFFQIHHIRKKFVKALEEEFPDSGLVFSIGEFDLASILHNFGYYE